MRWRRSYDTPPPPLPRRRPVVAVPRPPLRLAAAGDPSRAPSASPTSSCACCRTGTTTSSPTSRPGSNVLVAAHGNSLRALIKHLDGMSEADVVGLNVPDRHPAALRPRRRPPTADGRRPVPRRRGRGGRHRSGEEPGPALTVATDPGGTAASLRISYSHAPWPARRHTSTTSATCRCSPAARARSSSASPVPATRSR